MKKKLALLTLLVILALVLATLPAQGRDPDNTSTYPGPEITPTATPYPGPFPIPTPHHKPHGGLQSEIIYP